MECPYKLNKAIDESISINRTVEGKSRGYVAQDKKKGIPESGNFVDNVEIINFCLSNERLKFCAYCDTELNVNNISLDRIDNDRYHTLDNLVNACRGCNYARNDFLSSKDFKITTHALQHLKQNRNYPSKIPDPPLALSVSIPDEIIIASRVERIVQKKNLKKIFSKNTHFKATRFTPDVFLRDFLLIIANELAPLNGFGDSIQERSDNIADFIVCNLSDLMDLLGDNGSFQKNAIDLYLNN
ncbi:hypothetical protein ACTFIR_011385 [Dictyostelium discoideum]